MNNFVRRVPLNVTGLGKIEARRARQYETKNYGVYFRQSNHAFNCGGIMANFTGDTNCTLLHLPILLPCKVWNFIIWAFFTVLILDLLIYAIFPSIKKKLCQRKIPENLGTGINKETSEPRQFYVLAYHQEWVITNSDAKNVSNFLLRKLKEITQTVTIGNSTYYVDSDNIEFFDPGKNGTLEYAMVVGGVKLTAVHGFFNIVTSIATIDPLGESVDMFTIAVIQGGQNTSRVTFDTDARELFAPCSKGLEKDLKEGFSIRKKKWAKENQ